jgi:hypothetical protein
MRDQLYVRLKADYSVMDVAIPAGDQKLKRVVREIRLGAVEGMIRGRMVFVLA